MLKINGLDHLSVRTTEIDATRDFFEKVLDLKAGARPPFKFPGCWLYQEGDDGALIHIVGEDETANDYLGARNTSSEDTGALDHIAFSISDYDGMKDRLNRLGIPFVERAVPETGIAQLFIKDPNNITLELIFQPENA